MYITTSVDFLPICRKFSRVSVELFSKQLMYRQNRQKSALKCLSRDTISFQNEWLETLYTTKSYYLNTYIKWDTIFQTKMRIYHQNQWLNTVFRHSTPFLVSSSHPKSLEICIVIQKCSTYVLYLVPDIITSMIYSSEVYNIYTTLITHTIDNLLLHQTYLFQYSTFFYNLDQVPDIAHK